MEKFFVMKEKVINSEKLNFKGFGWSVPHRFIPINNFSMTT